MLRLEVETSLKRDRGRHDLKVGDPLRPISSRFVALLRSSLPVALAPDDSSPTDWARLAEIADALCDESPVPREAARALAARFFASIPQLESDHGKGALALYEHACHALLPDWAPGLEAHVDVHPSGAVQLWLRFAEDAFDATTLDSLALDALFEVLAGFAEMIPTLVGEPPASGALRRWPGQPIATLHLDAPASEPRRLSELARSALAILAQPTSTKQQRATASIAPREAEGLFSPIVQPPPELVVDASEEHGAEYISPSIREILGFEPHEVALEDRLHDDDRDDVIEYFLRARSHGDTARKLLRLRDREDNWHWFDATARGYEGQRGERRILVIARDVTQEQLAARERTQLTGLMQRSSDLMTLTSLTGEVHFLNDAGRALLGADGERWPRSVFDFFGPEQDARLRDEIIPILSREKIWVGELSLRHLDSGSAIPVSASFSILNDDRSAGPAALAVICQDLRKEQHAAKALLEATDRVTLLSESSFELISEIDSEGNFVSVSPAYETLLGYKREDLIGTRALDLIPTSEHEVVRAAFNKLIGEHGARTGKLSYLDASGNVRPGEATLVAYQSASGKPRALVVMRDLSEQFESEERLRESEERLRQSQKMEALGRLAGGIAHDFNNLLTAIIGHSDLLVGDLGEDHPSLPDVAEVLKASNRAAALTHQLLAFSRRQVLQVQTVDLNALVSGIDRMLRRVIGDQYRYVSSLEGSLWSTTADEGRIEQVILNLVVNARDAMPDGGEICVETSNLTLAEDTATPHGVVPAGMYVSLAVRDTGLGVDPDTLAHIFEPFFTTKPTGKGTGLGLSTVLGIVQQCGGHVWVESKSGSGTVFRVLLPRTHDVTQPRSPKRDFAATRASGVVLVLEDEPTVRNLVSRHLEVQGYEVLAAANGDEALEHCRCRPDVQLLLADIVMPGRDGASVAAELRAMQPSLRVAFMSGFPSDILERRGNDVSADTILQKPFTRERLLQHVEQALNTSA